MELTKISRSKSFEMVNGYGLKSWDKFGVEGDLGENESPLEAYNELGKIIDQAHKDSYPALSFVADNPTVPEVQVEKEQPKSLVEQIKSCTELKVLESYRLIAKVNPETQQAYDNKLKELKK